MLFKAFAPLAAIASVASAAALPELYHEADSEIGRLFVRRDADPNDPNFGHNYPPAGSTPPANMIPQAWSDKLKSVNMPDVPVATADKSGFPKYPDGHNPSGNSTCSITYQCREDSDLWKPADGHLALSFDDGPTEASPDLYNFLAQNNAADKATHFFIGGAIINNPTYLPLAANQGGHIGVHTWSHPYMTTLSNEDVLSELGWTMQVIADLNGGRVPKYWRPPYGDADNRVRTIAREVFGLYTVPWNYDSNDWEIGTNGWTHQNSVDNIMAAINATGRTPGAMILEHELNDKTVGVFKEMYPQMVSFGWNITNVADAYNYDWYQNTGNSNNGTVVPMSIAASAPAITPSSTSAAASSTSAPAASGSSAPAASGSSAAANSASGAGSASPSPSAAQSNTQQGAATLTASASNFLVLIAGAGLATLIL